MKALLALTLLASPALATDSLGGDLTVALPSPDAVGDGQTPVTVHVLTLAPDGSPIEGLEVKLKSKTAKEVGGWTYDGDGIYSFTVVPPRIEYSEQLWVSIKGKTADKLHKIDMAAKVPMRPTPPLSMTLTANPQTLVSGDSDEATLSFTLADGRNVDPEMLRIRTNMGEIGELAAMGGGRYVTKFNVAKVRNPGLALITVSDQRRPERVFGSLTIPISVKRQVSVRARSRSSVLLKVGDREFGPIDAKGGRAQIPDVMVPPGVFEATAVTATADGKTSESTVDLGVEVPRRLLLVPPFEGIPADPTLRVPIRVLVMTPEGKADAAAKPEVATTAGEVVKVENDGFGMHIITLAPALSSETTTHRLTVTLPDEPNQKDSIDLTLTPVRPTSIEVVADPDPLGEARAATLTATLTGPGDVPLTKRIVDFNLTGAKAAGPATAGEGTVIQPVQTFGGPAEILATAKVAGTGNAVHQLVVIPARSWLPGDTISSTMLTVLTLDVLGYPVGGVPVKLDLEKGDGSLPREVTTDADGVGQVFYTAGKDTEVVRVRAMAGEGSAVVALMQGPKLLRNVSLPVSGSMEQRALAAAWAKTITSKRVETE